MATLKACCSRAKGSSVERTAESSRLPTALAALVIACSASSALAEEAQRFSNPPDLQQSAPTQENTESTLLMRSTSDNTAEQQPVQRAGKERQLVLNIEYTDNQIYNPTTKRYDKVSLRSYTGPKVNADTPFVAPTINATPGDTVRVTLNNKLPKDPSCTSADATPDKPHCFNGTNLHSHGLWVSPAGNSDNVLLSINPQVSFQYEYNIPEDHPAGTFWYHPHRHGSTALQVGSGMAGALVIHGNRKPTPESNGDVDTLLKGANGHAFPERLLVMQQIPYACTNDDGKTYTWDCKDGQTGVIENYSMFAPSGANSWQSSGRYTSINGKVQPVFQTRSGQVERWRLVHAGIRDTLIPEFRKMADSARTLSENGVSEVESDQFVAQQCTGEAVPFQIIAADGLTLAQAQQQTHVTLQPGYRNDLLVMFPEPGRYCLIDKPTSANGSINQQTGDRQILGFVDVEAGKTVKDVKTVMTEELVAAAQRNMPANVREQVIADLKSDLKLTRFVPHQDVTDKELKDSGNLQQDLVFFVGNNKKGELIFAVGTDKDNVEPYQPNVINRQLTLGTAETWKLESAAASHPFHIHVNPFQVEKIIGPDGTDLSLPGAVDKADPADQQYAGLKGVWKDTLFVKGPSQSTDPDLKGKGYQVFVRTRYQRYIGEFVLHCHILDHEDQGMMQNVSISIPDGNGGTASKAHGNH